MGSGLLELTINLLQGVWRYYDERLLDCCRPLDVVRRQGITLAEFGCLARCNGLRAEVHRADLTTEEQFRKAIRDTSSYLSRGTAPAALCVSYHRGTLGQTGDGHFSPVGGYSEEDDMVLVLDVARFKYPVYWVDVSTLWKSLHNIDSISGRPRGFVILSRASDPPPFQDSLPEPATTKDLAPKAIPLTSLSLSPLNFRYFHSELSKPPADVLHDAQELVKWALGRLKEVTRGMIDGGGRFSVVERVERGLASGPAEDGAAAGNGQTDETEPEENELEQEWSALIEALG